MPTLITYDYAIFRIVPRVERGEFVNVGAVVSSDAAGYLKAAFEIDDTRLLNLDPQLDLGTIHAGLAAIARVCTGSPPPGVIGAMSLRERFHWLVAPRSTSIQTSSVHSGREANLDAALHKLIERMVRVRPVPRQA